MKSLGKILGGALVALFLVGCAGDRYSRSTGEVVDDRAIHARVKAALLNDPVTRGTAIDVDVNRGVVALSGAVNGEVEKRKAEDLVVGVPGVRSLENNLVVREYHDSSETEPRPVTEP